MITCYQDSLWASGVLTIPSATFSAPSSPLPSSSTIGAYRSPFRLQSSSVLAFCSSCSWFLILGLSAVKSLTTQAKRYGSSFVERTESFECTCWLFKWIQSLLSRILAKNSTANCHESGQSSSQFSRICGRADGRGLNRQSVETSNGWHNFKSPSFKFKYWDFVFRMTKVARTHQKWLLYLIRRSTCPNQRPKMICLPFQTLEVKRPLVSAKLCSSQ